MYTACQRTLQHHNSHKRTENDRQWKHSLTSWRWAYWLPKHVEKLLITNKSLIVASSWSHLYLLFKDARSFEYKVWKVCISFSGIIRVSEIVYWILPLLHNIRKKRETWCLWSTVAKRTFVKAWVKRFFSATYCSGTKPTLRVSVWYRQSFRFCSYAMSCKLSSAKYISLILVPPHPRATISTGREFLRPKRDFSKSRTWLVAHPFPPQEPNEAR